MILWYILFTQSFDAEWSKKSKVDQEWYQDAEEFSHPDFLNIIKSLEKKKNHTISYTAPLQFPSLFLFLFL